MKVDTLIAEINLRAVYDSIRLSVEEIETKHPERTDLIEPMRKHESNLKQVLFTWSERERVIKMLNNHIKNLEIENLELRHKQLFYDEKV
jgi:hypothetical protein